MTTLDKLAGFPGGVKALRRFIVWKAVTRRNGDVAKMPYRVEASEPASVANPDHWTDFETACRKADDPFFSGVGYVFAKGDGFVGIDLDDCLTRDADGVLQVADWACPWLANLAGSYAEESPSWAGIKIWSRGVLPGAGGRRSIEGAGRAGIEVYDQARYFCVTGDVFDLSPYPDDGLLPDHQPAIDDLYGWIKSAPKPTTATRAAMPVVSHETAAGSRWGRAALDAEVGKLAAAPAGDRNNQLFRSAAALVEVANGGHLDDAEVSAMLTASAATIGLAEAEARDTIASARRHVNGSARGPKPRPVPAPQGGGATATIEEGPARVGRVDDPHLLAANFLDGRKVDGTPTLRYWRDEFFSWSGSAWKPVPNAEIDAEVGLAVNEAFASYNAGQDNPSAMKSATRKVVGDVVAALRARCILMGVDSAPAWLIADPPFPAGEVLAARNALVHLPSFSRDGSGIIPPTPSFFNTAAIDYDFDPHAPRPVEWLKFLDSLWSDDPESIDCLQEVFGYHLHGEPVHEKLFLHIGPMRSGKGTVARTLRHMIGLANVAGPTLSSLASNFGLHPLVGKLAAIVDDARLSSKTDRAAAAERLLSISGRGELTIDRKYRDPITTTLPVRISILSNELPRLSDASGALASRYVILRYTRSFIGREDPSLSDRLLRELPGILRWAIEGRNRLDARGRFVQPTSGVDLHDLARDVCSPVGEFVRERCEVAPDDECTIAELYPHYVAWCREHGHSPRDSSWFGRDLAAAVGVTSYVKRTGSRVERAYKGIMLKVAF